MQVSSVGILLATVVLLEQPGAGVRPGVPAPGARVSLHAHNCYPERGLWNDRLQRALRTAARPIVIEQDLVWRRDPSSGVGQSVVAHDAEAETLPSAPTLDAHFFARLAPALDRALTEDRRDDWPIAILHLDFKTHEPEHHAEVWRLLGQYERWLTTAERVADPSRVMPLTPGPLMVLTENRPGSEQAFHDQVPVGERLRLFGTVPPAPVDADRETAPKPSALAPEILIPSGATNYRRWTNQSWAAVEAGGPPEGGAWTPGDRMRLGEIVRRAHDVGLWVRFYTLNGHAVNENHGWSASYNFGSLDAVRTRWRAAIEARVDFVATDQYEEFARELARSSALR